MTAPTYSELIEAVARAEGAAELREALRAVCAETIGLLGASHSSVWLLDRRAQKVRLAASSNDMSAHGLHEVAADDLQAPASRALNEDGPVLLPENRSAGGSMTFPASPVLAAPLRGRRRALGTLVIEGPWTQGTPGSSTPDPIVKQIRDTAQRLSRAIEHAQLFDELLRSRQELENAFNAIADPVAVCDHVLRLVYVNRAFAGRVARPISDILERPLAEFVGAEILDWIERRGGSADSTAGLASDGIQDNRLEGIFSVTVAPRATHDGEGVGFVIVLRDVSRAAALARERATLSERLVQSEKLAALGQFVAGIAHELNNPLQAVLGHLELVRTTASLSKPVARDLRLVYREAERAAKIVHNLLVFAGSRRLTRRPVSLNAIVTRALSLRGAQLRASGIEVVRRLDESLPRIHGDSLLLQQALLNIVINAEQAVAGVSSRRIDIVTSVEAAGDIVRAEIYDSGAGIPADVLPRIFEPFYTTKPVGQGTGLGLAIAYGIVQEHGGVILAGNHADGGALFTVRLPTHRKMVK